MSSELSGSYTVAVTPFTDDRSAVDIGRLKDFLDWQIEVGVPGIIALGTTGEFLAVSDEERRLLVDTYVTHINGRIPIVVGTMNAYTPNAVRYSREAEASGASGVMVLPPYYYTPTEDEIRRYYEAIDAALSIPIMLYNNPVTSNVDMSAKLVGKLAKELVNVQYIKEASLDLARVPDVIQEAEGNIKVFAGERVVDSYRLGAIGYVNPYGNYIPVPSYRICDLAAEGRLEEAYAIQRMIDRIDHVIAEGHPTYGHQCYSKALASMVGHPVGDVREPLTTIAQLGEEGKGRLAIIKTMIEELEDFVAGLPPVAASDVGSAGH